MTPAWQEPVTLRRRPAFRCTQVILTVLVFLLCWVPARCSMTDDEIDGLRRDTVKLFYHGFDNYMKYAYPEDELKPVSCQPLSRDQEDPTHIELNDVLGNYSLTLIDSLSTLAVLASAPEHVLDGRQPLKDFQDSVANLVDLYGDGSEGPAGHGTRAKGFAFDSKVQVFETVIRGVGGLLSGHLFAVGELPITGYHPEFISKSDESPENGSILWPGGFQYDGQLLRLALDLTTRLLPAFYTSTGIPYPRVNLLRGVPFYKNSPLNVDEDTGQCEVNESGNVEITETCSAGAGSLVLEMTILSRLTGDTRFENLAKQAFEAIWQHRSAIDLIGAGIDAETGQWVTPYTGIGAGVDSFFEYAFKSHILLSRDSKGEAELLGMNSLDFLDVWESAHSGILRHLYRDKAFQHPHYIQGDLNTGAARAFWFDSLSAYYPGLLVLAGEVDEAVEMHMLFAALWTRYSALPERWNTVSGNVDSGLHWWGGRPEFIESTWYLYKATNDAWYLYVGKMVLRDIQRRCWTPCGWAGLEDVRNGELKDRMESFFLGETAKYLYLLFDRDHPLNRIDAPWVMTTEGHPVILPRSRPFSPKVSSPTSIPNPSVPAGDIQPTCPAFQTPNLLGGSDIVDRSDFYHASALARLHKTLYFDKYANGSAESAWNEDFFGELLPSRTSHAIYPWSLPDYVMDPMGMSGKIGSQATFDLSFPTIPSSISAPLSIQRTNDGILVSSVSGLKLSMIREQAWVHDDEIDQPAQAEVFRINAASQMSLGRDEKVSIAPAALTALNAADPYFTRHRDLTQLEILLDIDESMTNQTISSYQGANLAQGNFVPILQSMLHQAASAAQQHISLQSLYSQVQQLQDTQSKGSPRSVISGTIATGVGAPPPPDVADGEYHEGDLLPWAKVYVMDSDMCNGKVRASIPKDYQVLVVPRGGCSFSEKLRNIPSFAPGARSLQLVVVVSYPDQDPPDARIRPMLDQVQVGPTGVVRRTPIPMVMVGGGHEVMDLFRSARRLGLKRKYYFSSQGLRISNLVVL